MLTTNPESAMKIQGRVHWNAKGFAFVVPEEGRDDVFVPPEGLMGAMNGDLVEVWAHREKRGLRGEVLSVIKRNPTTVSGTYREKKKRGIIIPFDPFPYTVVVPHECRGTVRDGDLVTAVVTPPKDVSRTRSVTARIERLLDIPENTADDLRYVAIKYGLPWLFPEEVEREALKVSRIRMEEELPRRRDLRDRVLFTIDGVTAKDFDDAVGIEKLGDGSFLLTVAIADVAHLVKKGTLLDREAFNRGFSVYFPEEAIPMLPEVLSNGVLSLKPEEDRLVIAVEIRLGPRGKVLEVDCFDAVIHSRARLTYEELNPFLKKGASPDTLDPEVARRVVELHRMAGHLYRNRTRKGALDFDISEVGITIGHDGDVDRVYRYQRGPAEKLIEEAMLCANHAVCGFLEKHGMPILYRVHEKPSPDDLMALYETLSEIGLEKEELASFYRAIQTRKNLSFALQRISTIYSETPLHSFVNQHILRALKRAKYWFEDLGHFGLGTESYTHFTSPIRRYSDLIIHRILKSVFSSRGLTEKERDKLRNYVKFISPEVSDKERKTDDAMFEVIRLKTAAYMQRHLGDEFSGVVTSILPWGMFVEIFDPPFDGLVSLSDVKSARIEEGRAVKFRRRTISIGDIVNVRVSRVDPLKGHVDFMLVNRPRHGEGPES
ncbi:MAG TPA: VacB/RNase II family 3'-5' exoribonuclease [Deltaproteobacteria bacterium]|nr:VacB/RNase II family 3'-5' exoribonuclease [Deltaproteobacteria bacterium]HOI06308.1 VacB/RNase II family 3'-5' exoribonuclease [Deltaproteobacteria bacterium]